jgi:hypothetical protein
MMFERSSSLNNLKFDCSTKVIATRAKRYSIVYLFDQTAQYYLLKNTTQPMKYKVNSEKDTKDFQNKIFLSQSLQFLPLHPSIFPKSFPFCKVLEKYVCATNTHIYIFLKNIMIYDRIIIQLYFIHF